MRLAGLAGVSGFWRYADVAFDGGGGDDSLGDATADADCSIVFISTSGTCLLSFVVGVVVGVVVVAADVAVAVVALVVAVIGDAAVAIDVAADDFGGCCCCG